MSSAGQVTPSPLWQGHRLTIQSLMASPVRVARRWPSGTIAAGLTGVVLTLYMIFSPNSAGIVIDEWAYLKAAQQLTASGTFGSDPTAIAPDLMPVMVSGVLGRIVGHQLLWLRIVSAVSFVAMGILAYLLAAELGASKRWAVACGILAAANPIAIPLAVTGMSDLPATALMWAACLLGMRFVRRPSWGLALGCCSLSLAGAATRPVAIVPAVVLGGCAVLGVSKKWLYGAGAVAALITLGIFAVGVAIFAENSASTGHYLYKAMLAPARVWAKMLLLYPAQTALYIALVTIPFSAGVLVGNVKRVRMLTGALVGAFFGLAASLLTSSGTLRFPYMSWGSIVAANGIGGGDRPVLSGTLLIGVSGLVGASAGVVATVMASGAVRFEASQEICYSMIRRVLSAVRQPSCLQYLLGVLGLLFVAAGIMGFAFEDARTGYDRYLIPLFGPSLALISLIFTKSRGWYFEWKAWSVALVTVLAIVVVGVQEWAVYKRTTWAELESLTLEGILPTDIDGGFEWNAYHQPNQYVPAFDPKADVPWYIREFAPATDREFVVASAPVGGYEVIKTVEWKGWIRKGKLYVQVRSPS